MLNEENPKPISSLKEDNDYNNSLYWLINSALLDFVIREIPTSWIRKYNDHLAIYPSRKGVFLDSVNRDKLLADLHQNQKIIIDKPHLIKGTTLLYGSDINFIYLFDGHSYFFQWYRDDKVYLMDEGFSSYKMKKVIETDEESYFFFDTTEIVKELNKEFNQDFFLNKLKELIELTHNYKKRINYTVVCVNEFAKVFKIGQKESFDYLSKYKGIDFLKEHYDIEHTLSIDDAVDDLIKVCRNNGGTY